MIDIAASPTRTTAVDVCRGVGRHFHRAGQVVLAEVPLPNGRRADLVAIDGQGLITIVEVKVARADLISDKKWPDYLDWCDRFCWALSPDLDPAVLDDDEYLPSRVGVLIADRYDAVELRAPAVERIAPARRRAETLRIGRLAMRRMMIVTDPDLAMHAAENDIGV
jgi:hypothetical protein